MTKIRQFVALILSGPNVLTIDGIEYQDKLWLVPEWLESTEERIRKPNRMIRFDILEHQHVNPSKGRGHEYVVNHQVPEAVLKGETTEGFEVLSASKIPFGIRRGTQH